MKTIKINECDVPRMREWIEKRGGIAVWNSVDMSDPGWQCYTPANNEDGTPTSKPSWKSCQNPGMIVTSEAHVVVVVPKEVYRFPVHVRPGDQGMRVKLTDASSERLRKVMARYSERHDYVHYEFDYMEQEAVIFASDDPVPLSQYQPKGN